MVSGGAGNTVLGIKPGPPTGTVALWSFEPSPRALNLLIVDRVVWL